LTADVIFRTKGICGHPAKNSLLLVKLQNALPSDALLPKLLNDTVSDKHDKEITCEKSCRISLCRASFCASEAVLAAAATHLLIDSLMSSNRFSRLSISISIDFQEPSELRSGEAPRPEPERGKGT
jgi:hypothetical protein